MHCGADRRARGPTRGHRRRSECLCALPLRGQAERAQAAARCLPRPRGGVASRRASRLWMRRCHRRFRPSCLRERAAIPLQERPRAGTLLRSRRLLGTPLGRLDPQGWRLLRVQAPRSRVCANRPPARLRGQDGPHARVVCRRRSVRRADDSRLLSRDGRARQGRRRDTRV